jgi:Probable lipoprotein LpqN
MIMHRAARAAAAAMIVVVAATGCSQVVTGTAQRVSSGQASGPAACTKVDAPLQDIPAGGGTEPKLRVPQPANWKRVSRMNRGIIRYVMGNPKLFSNMFTPNIVVTLEKASVLDAQTIFADNERRLRKRTEVSDLASSPGTLCGLPADTVTFHGSRIMSRGQRSVTTLVVVAGVGSRQYVVTVTAQTADPDNPTYDKDVKTVMRGLQVLAPTI